jgi:hypothetical protein
LKILSKRQNYNDQTNDATVEWGRRYFGKNKMVACGMNALSEGLEISEWPMDKAPGAQFSDYLMMIFNNPHNEGYFEKIRHLDFEKYPPNEVPQLFPAATKLIYGKEACSFHWDLSFQKIIASINSGRPIIACGKFPAGGHYVLVVGYDENKIIFDDPYWPQWDDKNGFNRKMNWEDFSTITEGSGRDFYIQMSRY